jgi:hypothetical protein
MMGASSQRALEEQLADERLRDAAPELLATLKAIFWSCDVLTKHCEASEAEKRAWGNLANLCRRSIRDATGEEP